MRKNEKILKDELKKIENLLSTVQKEMSRISVEPNDKVIVSKKGKHSYYYLGKKGEGRGKYVSKVNMPYVKDVIQKKYLKDVEKQLKKMKSATENAYKCCDMLNVLDIYEKMPEARKRLTDPIIETDEEYIERWLAEHPGGKNGYPMSKSLQTNRGEVVRTKAEKIIADELYRRGIPYQYEPALRLDKDKVKYPDFIVLNVNERKTYWLEHFGLTNDEVYIQNSLDKLIAYERNGIVIGENLIVTLETETHAQDIKALERKIERYLL